MKSFTIILGFLLLCFTFLGGQITLTTNGESLDNNRYAGIKGSPFLFETDVKATLYATDGSIEEDVNINFNGLDGSFEYTENGKLVRLNEKIYKKVILVDDKKKSYKFINTAHYEFDNDYVLVLAEADDLVFVRTNDIKMTTVTYNKPGKIETTEKFSPDFFYYIIQNGERIKVKLKKKSIEDIFGDVAGFASFTKQNKLKFNREEDVVALVEWIKNM